MRGHQEIIRVRLDGWAPSLVNIDLDMDEIPESSRTGVLFENNDRVSEIDWRFVYGLKVAISGMTATRVAAIGRSCLAGGAERVVGTVSIPKGKGQWEAIEVFDSEGALGCKF